MTKIDNNKIIKNEDVFVKNLRIIFWIAALVTPKKANNTNNVSLGNCNRETTWEEIKATEC